LGAARFNAKVDGVHSVQTPVRPIVGLKVWEIASIGPGEVRRRRLP
jgi:hypothetical protein